jgi:hypothetical protein
MSKGRCPSFEQLAAFSDGTLPGASLDAVATHLGDCIACQLQLAELDSRTNPVVEALRVVRTADWPTAAGPAYLPTRSQVGAEDRTPVPEEPLPLPGRIGDYEVLGELGRGGMAVVYKAWQVRLKRTIALKMLLGSRLADPQFRARFRSEGELLARLQHPNIVQIFDVGEHDGQPYLALEYVDGGSLSTRLEGRPQLPVRAAQWTETLARAVHHAHQQGLIHRDLKPANVLVTHDGALKVTDFGLAKLREGAPRHTASGMIVGTPEFMAPEQAKNQGVGPAVDIYALGAMLYAMLTGRPPLQAPTPMQTLVQITRQEPLPPRRLQPEVPRDLETICLKCLKKDPGQRYASALELADDLKRFLEGAPIRARPGGPIERLWKWAKRHRALVAAAAACLLVASANLALSIGWVLRDQAVRQVEGERQMDAARQEATARRDVERLVARLSLDKAVLLCERGDLADGLLWLARALEWSVRVGDADLERRVRVELGAWQPAFVREQLRRQFHPGWLWIESLDPGGRLSGNGKTQRGEPLRQVPVVGGVEQVRLWIETLTCRELVGQGAVRELGAAAQRQRRQQLEQAGGPPRVVR